MGAALREIHGIRRDGFGYAVKAADNLEPANSTFMHGAFDKRAAVYSELTGDHETVDAARAYVAEREPLFDLCTTPVLLHGDFTTAMVTLFMTCVRNRFRGQYGRVNMCARNGPRIIRPAGQGIDFYRTSDQ